jgi:hypothetical protein
MIALNHISVYCKSHASQVFLNRIRKMAIIVHEIGVVVRVTQKLLSLTPKWVPTAVSNMAPIVTLQNDDVYLPKIKTFSTKELP